MKAFAVLNGHDYMCDASTAEECLRVLELHLKPEVGWDLKLTFQPSSGRIFANGLSNTACGIIYSAGYPGSFEPLQPRN